MEARIFLYQYSIFIHRKTDFSSKLLSCLQVNTWYYSVELRSLKLQIYISIDVMAITCTLLITCSYYTSRCTSVVYKLILTLIKTILLYSIFRANCILEEVFIDLKNIKCFEELMTKQWYEKHVLYKLIMFKVYVACMRVFFFPTSSKTNESIF